MANPFDRPPEVTTTSLKLVFFDNATEVGVLKTRLQSVVWMVIPKRKEGGANRIAIVGWSGRHVKVFKGRVA
jgi:hypothetical protein